MGITATSGPDITFGVIVGSTGNVSAYNEQRGPSLMDLGDGMLDPRSQYNYGYSPGAAVSNTIFGFWGQQGIVDFIPSTISSNAIAAASTGNGAGAALTLTATGAGITLVTSITAPETGKLITGTLLAIDTPCGGSSAAGVAFGQAGTVNIWNPASLCGRCITILATGADGGTWSIAGRDAYGFKVTETIAVSGSLMTSKKAYKYISAINASTTLASTTIIVGTADTYGFPLRVDTAPYVAIWIGPSSNQYLVTTSTGNHVFASSLATATSTNGDVRGTYASTLASNSTAAAPVRIAMFVSPTVTNLSSAGVTLTSYAGIFGATQFSSV